jgi:hypothetical protein
MYDVSQARSRWLLPLFQLLDFAPVYQRSDTVVDESLRFSFSHRGWDPAAWGLPAPVLHTAPPSQDLDARAATLRGPKGKSPHDQVQTFLNVSPADRWAILTNGVLLRLLRDYHHTFTKGYVEFDLESMFEARAYGDFRALYRLCHASRFIPHDLGGDEPDLPLERFYRDSLAAGIQVGTDLREQVRQAIETLGNGLLTGPLIARLQADDALCHQFLRELLHVVYRILFLLFAEQRGMMPGRNRRTLPGRDSLYAETYSMARLRARAEGDIPRRDDHVDLWHGLQVTFRMVREGVPELGVFGYDGMLFAEGQTPLLDGLPSPCEGEGPGMRVGIPNSDLLQAIRFLTLVERDGVLQRISYADLGVEELGSIYESLLDYTPRVSTAPENVSGREVPAHTFFLDPRGSERKTTGSYYTHPSLVNELIKSALLPVARDRLAQAGLPVIAEDAIGEAAAGLLTDYADLTAAQRAAGERVILSLKVCDPAAGSGHFLVKANNALGAELARIRSGDEYPSQEQVQAARRDVLAHCIYAVDLNPMAVELCKVSLWINAAVADRPLSFLDHHIKCGNSLIGAMVRPGSPQAPALLKGGIPTDAFQTVTGDPVKPGLGDPATVNRVRERNRREQEDWQAGRAVQGTLFQVVLYEPGGAVRQEYVLISDLAEAAPNQARERYAAYLAAGDYRRRKMEADLWTAAFFWPLSRGTGRTPTHGALVRLQAEGPASLPPAALAQVETLADRYRFFHWHLEFPDVFGDDGAGGFDVVLGNPPWERIKLQEKEFFADKDPAVANAPTAAARRKLIAQLTQTNPALADEYAAELRASECESNFLRNSGRFPLTGVGDVNTYAVFTELARSLIAPQGRAGLVVPTGIATDYTYRDFFADMMRQGALVSLHDFENRRGLFPDVDSRMKFSLLTLSGGGMLLAEFAFFLHTVDDVADPERCFPLSGTDLAILNPNTRTVPVFRTHRDAELTRKLYRAAPVLQDEQTGDNPWGIHLWTMFHMANDSSLFHTWGQLEAEGFSLDGNRCMRSDEVYLPLYEAKMFHQYDHRAANVVENSSRLFRSGQPDVVSLGEHLAPEFTVMPRYWVSVRRVLQAIPAQHPKSWLFGYKNVTSPTNERTFIGTILPRVAAGHSVQFIYPNGSTTEICALVANLNALAFDFVAKQKLGGINFSYFVLKQLPVLPPDRFPPTLLAFIVPRVVELTYTAWDLQAFAQDVLAEVGLEAWARWFAGVPVHTSPPPAGQPATPAPFVWDEERRARLRAELDALYAHLYGLTRDELSYILDTVPIVRRKDEKRWGDATQPDQADGVGGV